MMRKSSSFGLLAVVFVGWATVACGEAAADGGLGGAFGSGGSTSGSGGALGTGGAAATGGALGTGGAAATGGAGTGGAPAVEGPRVIAYLYDWSGKYANWATSMDFGTLTHVNLAFCNPGSNGSDDNAWDIGGSDADLKTFVDAAHAAGVKVLVSLGGGGGDVEVTSRYGASNVAALVDKLDSWVDAHDIDGVDVDIEAPGNDGQGNPRMGAKYTTFITQVVAKLRPKGHLVTAAMAQWMQSGMEDAALEQFDFINVMAYTNYEDTKDQIDWYQNTKGVDPKKIVVGAAFFGVSDPYKEWAYEDILAADSNAWSKNTATVGGKTVHYSGQAEIALIAEYSKDYGGIMFWDWVQDSSGEHSLFQAIKDTM